MDNDDLQEQQAPMWPMRSRQTTGGYFNTTGNALEANAFGPPQAHSSVPYRFKDLLAEKTVLFWLQRVR